MGDDKKRSTSLADLGRIGFSTELQKALSEQCRELGKLSKMMQERAGSERLMADLAAQIQHALQGRLSVGWETMLPQPSTVSALLASIEGSVSTEIVREAERWRSHVSGLEGLSGSLTATMALQQTMEGHALQRILDDAARSREAIGLDASAFATAVSQLAAHRAEWGDIGEQVSHQLAAMSTAAEQWRSQAWALEHISEPLATYVRTFDMKASWVLGLTTLAGASLSRVQWEDLGGLVGLPAAERAAVESAQLSMAESYSAVLGALDGGEHWLEGGHAVLRQLSPVEFYSACDLLEEISTPQVDRTLGERRRDRRDEIHSVVCDDLDTMLDEIDPEFARIRRGAQKALESGNPDRARHVAISARELVLGVIHGLAPDDRVLRWPDDRLQLDRHNHPTRESKMLFIGRSLEHASYLRFFQEDVKAGIRLIDVLHETVHRPSCELTQGMLKALWLRVDALLRLLLEVARLRAAD